MQWYYPSDRSFRRLSTLEVRVGDLLLGNFHPIRIQTMTTTDTLDTLATVDQSIRCIEAGAELIRITAPSKKEAENLLPIKNELRKRGYHTPLVADIHFTPNAAEIAARIVEKVRINPGNYIDKKKFEFIEYTDSEYHEEIDRIRDRFRPLVKICKEYGTAMRIGTNHGSLSDRIMSRYGDTPMGMVESAMEFLRVARDENYHAILLSMKSSNPLVMVQAYRLLIQKMDEEFGACYPLHLGVTEAGDGEDGRIKSAIGIGSLLEDGIGDTIRVSLTEDPELEIPVCRDLVKRYPQWEATAKEKPHLLNSSVLIEGLDLAPSYSPFAYNRRTSQSVLNIGAKHVPIVVADFRENKGISPADLQVIGYSYDEVSDKWKIGDAAADFLYSPEDRIEFSLPGTLRVICDYPAWLGGADPQSRFPLFQLAEYLQAEKKSEVLNWVACDSGQPISDMALEQIKKDTTVVLCIRSSQPHPMAGIRRFIAELMVRNIRSPLILEVESRENSLDEQLIHFAIQAGASLLDGLGDGIWLRNDPGPVQSPRMNGRTYMEAKNNKQFINNTSFSILQATRSRISKTDYISCPSCGRTLFDLQEITAKIRAVTHHLKGVKIAIMGCIVNGPGEMADADFGYVGSGPGKVTLYKGKEIVKRGISNEIAVQELINLIRESQEWVEPGLIS
jgi:(E)-4-hydroxy-3-methylbut-2-enyl-diphosphate synthase